MYICGQGNLLSKIDRMAESDRFPRFILLIGDYGFGKKVVSEYIADKLSAMFVPCSIDVDSVRSAITDSLVVGVKTVYAFFDCDNMSLGAKNALLKAIEEPEKNAYFIMTARNPDMLLGTILSRGTVFNMDAYSPGDITEYMSYYTEIKGIEVVPDKKKLIEAISVCPNDIITYINSNVDEIYDLADKFIQFIGDASIANELKITGKLKLKQDGDGIDPVAFLRCVLVCCNKLILNDPSGYDTKIFYMITKRTADAITEITKNGANKKIVVDNYIINLHIDIAGGVS